MVTSLQAVNDYTTGARAGSPGKWKLMRRKLVALDQAFRQCAGFLGELVGDVLPPVFKNEQDEHEHAILGPFPHRASGAVHQVLGRCNRRGRCYEFTKAMAGIGEDLLDRNHRK
jgi:hypothetical protein